MHFRLAFALITLALSLASCIEGDEELWLHADGSGRIETTYRMPPAIMNRLGGAETLKTRLQGAVEKEPSVRIETLDYRLEGPLIVFELKADFDDVRTFIELPKKHLSQPSAGGPSAEESLFGMMNLQLSGLSLDFERTIDLSPVLPASIQNNAAMLGESAFNYTLHLPAKPTSQNADSVGPDGKSLHWSFLLRDHAKEPMQLETRMLLPLPWWVWTIGALLVLLIALVGFKLLKRLIRPSP
jgi:hypothetical protein